MTRRVLPPWHCIYCGEPRLYHTSYHRIACRECDGLRRPIQWAAYIALRKAIRNGLVRRARDQVCADCGVPACEHDHRDYRRPLDVTPVCRRCNMLRGPAEFFDRANVASDSMTSPFVTDERTPLRDSVTSGAVTYHAEHFRGV